MTQVGESVQLGEVDTDEVKCPFDHDNPKPPEVDNELIGVGSKLAAQMKSGRSTHLYKPLVKEQPKVLSPNKNPAHAFFQKKKVVEIVVHDAENDTDITHQYPVTCAAHHLIPAQESLKLSALRAYMVKKGQPEPLEGGNYSDGIVWADVGYNVNGAENGVYLPGSYAVGGGRGGMKVWRDNDDIPDQEKEVQDDVIDPNSNVLSGELNQIDDSNRKWLYVKQAVEKAPGQFHDRHQAYSEFVLSVLEKIATNYNNLKKQYFDTPAGCPDCRKRSDAQRKAGVPTPFGMVARLNGASERMSGFLNGSTWRRNVFTSKWGGAFMEHELAKKKTRKRKRGQR